MEGETFHILADSQGDVHDLSLATTRSSGLRGDMEGLGPLLSLVSVPVPVDVLAGAIAGPLLLRWHITSPVLVASEG